MTKKHFKAIASIFADMLEHPSFNDLGNEGKFRNIAIRRMADFCSTMNPNFKLETFFAACKLSDR